jgi:hypothetical protein
LTVDTVKEYSNWGDNAAPFFFSFAKFYHPWRINPS